MRRQVSVLVLWVAVATACANGSVPTGGDDASIAPEHDAATTIDARQGAGFGEPCTGNGDCASGLCYKPDSADTGFCTDECTGQCPAGYACKVVSIADGTDVRICVPAEDTMCRTCTVNADCGDSSDFCIEFTGGKFCSIDCASDPTVCPLGFTCQVVSGSGETITGKQCMPVNGICCVDADGDFRGEGDGCVTTDCDDTNAAVYDDAAEICDGYDNDCVGGVDVDPIDCATPTCQLGQFGYFERAGEPCESGACVAQPAKPCGLYTCAGGGEDGDACATACDGEDDSKCIPTAHCDASVCYADLDDGQVCDEASDCKSGHCQNGFCCSGGDCCQKASDCPTFGTYDPVCENPSTCQGTRGEAVCTASFTCATTGMVQDDSACTSATVANQCGWYLPIYCSGAVDQSPPECPTSCTTHAQCDPGAFCHPTSKTCVEDLPNGEVCEDDAARCKSGHCQNGFCCDGGDCCQTENDCPGSYSTDPVCTVPSACQGKVDLAQCVKHACTTSTGVDDDSACGPGVVANECGPYQPIHCDGNSVQTPPVCPTSCTSDADCDTNAYCNAGGACVPDEPDGNACQKAGQCQSGHCQNGFCCAGGDCCAKHSDCDDFDEPSLCSDATTCQGTRVDGVCTGTFQCATQVVNDDSGCAGLEADDCGPYPSKFCTNAQHQNQPACAATCTTDADCDASAHCDNGACVPDQGQGGYCTKPSDCESGLHCVDNVCCNTACNGTCEACDLPGAVGVCTLVAAGADPDNECGAVSCAGFFWGWTADTCYQKADVSAAQATCNGAGACYSQAQECTKQTAKGGPTVTCDDDCQDPKAATCTGTTPGSCNNVNPGDQTCGTGVCQVTVPMCLNGGDNTCTPGAPQAEVCNDLDDNCDGVVDNGAFSDWAEPNGSCASVTSLAKAGSDQGWLYNNLTLFGAGDEDFFVARLEETDNSCGCGFPWLDEDYLITVTLKVPANAGSYQVCMNINSCSFSNCTTVLAGQTGTITQWADGACPGSDNYDLYMRVRGIGAPGFECTPYELSYEFDAGYCK